MKRFLSLAVFTAMIFAISGCGSKGGARTIPELVPTAQAAEKPATVVILQKQPVRGQPTIEGLFLSVASMERTDPYRMRLADVQIAEPDPSLNGTYFMIEGHYDRYWHVNAYDKMTIFVRMPGQKMQWQNALKKVLAPHDDVPVVVPE